MSGNAFAAMLRCCGMKETRLGLIFAGGVVMFGGWDQDFENSSDFDVFLQKIVRRQHESSTKKN